MTFTIIIWLLVVIATGGMFFALYHSRKYFQKVSLSKYDQATSKYILLRYQSIVTIFLTLVWWLSLLIFELVRIENNTSNDIYTVFIVLEIVLSIVFYIILISIEKQYESKLQLKNNKTMSFHKLLCLFSAVTYALSISYGIQAIIILA